jgi:hypothetical protein
MVELRRYSQNDPRWSQLVYAGGATFAFAGCLVCCVTMIASLAYADEITPVEVAYHLRRAKAFAGALLSHPDRISVAFNRLQWAGAVHYRDILADMGVIATEIATYGAVIVELKWNPRKPLTYVDKTGAHWNQHFGVLVGVSDDATDATLVDPWDGEMKLLSESRYRLDGWDAARTVYGLRLVRPVLE